MPIEGCVMVNPSTQAPFTIGRFIGLLADYSSHRASLNELNAAAAAGWAAVPAGQHEFGPTQEGNALLG